MNTQIFFDDTRKQISEAITLITEYGWDSKLTKDQVDHLLVGASRLTRALEIIKRRAND